MEETIGKRIAGNRKRLGITQDRLAERLGVTAQAVSKWENDQSCPDITMLPKLAETFGITTDALLGIAQPEPPKAMEAEPVTEEQDNESDHKWDVRWEAGRSGSIGLAVWIIITAGILFAANWLQLDISMWDLLWTNGLIVFGLFTVIRKFSFFSLGCALLGGYFLLDKLNVLPSSLSRDLLLPAILLLFGLAMLVKALRKPRNPQFSVSHNGKSVNRQVSSCNFDEDAFHCSSAFCEKQYSIDLPRLRTGEIDMSCGELTVDLTAVGEFVPGCTVEADCAFGELTILVPGHIRAEVNSDIAFGSVDVVGNYDPEPDTTIRLDADVSFGRISIQYV